MFFELTKGNISDGAVESLRRKYGFLDKNKYINCDTRHLEEESTLHCTPTGYDEEIVSVTRVRRSRRIKEEEPLLENGKIT